MQGLAASAEACKSFLTQWDKADEVAKKLATFPEPELLDEVQKMYELVPYKQGSAALLNFTPEPNVPYVIAMMCTFEAPVSHSWAVLNEKVFEGNTRTVHEFKSYAFEDANERKPLFVGIYRPAVVPTPTAPAPAKKKTATKKTTTKKRDLEPSQTQEEPLSVEEKKTEESASKKEKSGEQ